jgi:hypothetical protein
MFFAPCPNSFEQESAEEAKKRIAPQIFQLAIGAITLLPLLPPVKWILVAAKPRRVLRGLIQGALHC